ncbi:DUF4192 family protein [Leucobacter luti]|uniref:Uncharacterized protein DUF4192 n=1 Tax=Leucobacter luti TaxID=340320 RepID=A0A4Q7U4I1_9MICO|nr:DUF4192 family protein [Leucobacter luti]RZT68611.1 uncharacterized protein DUF4192 [Leucobacter luti]
MTQPQTAPSPAAPRVLTCHTPADYLAALPLLLGFTPQDCLVAVCFSGSRSGPALRINLPPDDSPERVSEFVDVFVSALDSLHDAPHGRGHSAAPPHAVAIAIVTDERFADERFADPPDASGAAGPPGAPRVPRVPRTPHAPHAPHAALARGVKDALIGAGLAVRELCCLAADGWVSYLDPHAPAGGHPLSEIETSPIALAATLRGDEVRDFAAVSAIPEADPQRAAAVVAALARLQRSAPSERPSIQRTAAAARMLRRPQALTPRDTAALIRTLAHPVQWFGVVLGILLPPERAAVLMSEPQTGAQLRRIAGDTAAGVAQHRGALLFLLASLSPEFTEHERLPAVRDRLRTAIAECPSADRAPLLALSAWLWWMCGIQSVAQVHVDAARDIDPNSVLALTVDRVIVVPSHVKRVPDVVGSGL